VKMKRRSKGSVLSTSLISILLTFLMLATSTFAWFMTEAGGRALTIKTGTFGVEVQVREVISVLSLSNDLTAVKDTVVIDVVTGNKTAEISLVNGKSYEIWITALGDATEGFCLVAVGNEKYHTEPLANGETISFTLNLSGDGETLIRFSPYWGTYRTELNEYDDTIIANTVIGELPVVIDVEESSESETTTEAKETTEPEESTESETTTEAEETTESEESTESETTTEAEETTEPEESTESETTTEAEETTEPEESTESETTTEAEETTEPEESTESESTTEAEETTEPEESTESESTTAAETTSAVEESTEC